MTDRMNDARRHPMSGHDEARVEKGVQALRTSRLLWGTHADRWRDTEWQAGFWREAVTVVLDAVADDLRADDRRRLAAVEALAADVTLNAVLFREGVRAALATGGDQ